MSVLLSLPCWGLLSVICVLAASPVGRSRCPGQWNNACNFLGNACHPGTCTSQGCSYICNCPSGAQGNACNGNSNGNRKIIGPIGFLDFLDVALDSMSTSGIHPTSTKTPPSTASNKTNISSTSKSVPVITTSSPSPAVQLALSYITNSATKSLLQSVLDTVVPRNSSTTVRPTKPTTTRLQPRALHLTAHAVTAGPVHVTSTHTPSSTSTSTSTSISTSTSTSTLTPFSTSTSTSTLTPTSTSTSISTSALTPVSSNRRMVATVHSPMLNLPVPPKVSKVVSTPRTTISTSGAETSIGSSSLTPNRSFTTTAPVTSLANLNSHRSSNDTTGQSFKGDNGHSVNSDNGHSTNGDNGYSGNGDNSYSSTADNGHSSNGDNGHSSNGDNGHSSSGNNGQSSKGYNGYSTKGNASHVASGDNRYSLNGDNGHHSNGENGHYTNGDSNGQHGYSNQGVSGNSNSSKGYGTDVGNRYDLSTNLPNIHGNKDYNNTGVNGSQTSVHPLPDSTQASSGTLASELSTVGTTAQSNADGKTLDATDSGLQLASKETARTTESVLGSRTRLHLSRTGDTGTRGNGFVSNSGGTSKTSSLLSGLDGTFSMPVISSILSNPLAVPSAMGMSVLGGFSSLKNSDSKIKSDNVQAENVTKRPNVSNTEENITSTLPPLVETMTTTGGSLDKQGDLRHSMHQAKTIMRDLQEISELKSAPNPQMEFSLKTDTSEQRSDTVIKTGDSEDNSGRDSSENNGSEHKSQGDGSSSTSDSNTDVVDDWSREVQHSNNDDVRLDSHNDLNDDESVEMILQTDTDSQELLTSLDVEFQNSTSSKPTELHNNDSGS